MLTIAQTNLQLYAELSRQRRSVSELRQVHAAYGLAMQLFSARFRASGKPFLAHLVGTASVLASLGQSTAVVAAGLLHASFEQGDFGDGAKGITASRQQRLRQAVGDETTELVGTYQCLSRRQAMARLSSDVAADFTTAERGVLLIHLADTLEEHTDGGMRYAPCKGRFFDRAGMADVATATVAALERLGLGAYSPAFSEVFAAAECCNPPAELLSTQSSSFSVLPASCRERPAIWWRKVCQKFWQSVSFRRRNAEQPLRAALSTSVTT